MLLVPGACAMYEMSYILLVEWSLGVSTMDFQGLVEWTFTIKLVHGII